jgi:3-oxoacyl-[acyl-carrier protein] reductase
MHRLTAAKESGATIEIEGKKVALGIPGAKPPSQATPDTYPHIPLRRIGTADEAAAATLLYVRPNYVLLFPYQGLSSLASPLAAYVSGHTLEVTGGAGI